MRRRRRQRQLGLTFRELDKNGQHRGGARPGSGPKPRLLENGKRLHAHVTRPDLDGRNHPVHVTMRTSRALPSLRTRDLWQAIRLALVCAARRRARFRIVHVSIQRDHLHLLVEARDRVELANGIRAFGISAAKRLNRRMSQHGRVFIDRYHATPITSPTQARHALAYVLNNWRKHGEAEGRTWRIDPFSSGFGFGGWREQIEAPCLCRPPPTYEPMTVSSPHTWLLRIGWTRAGTVSMFERPGSARPR